MKARQMLAKVIAVGLLSTAAVMAVPATAAQAGPTGCSAYTLNGFGYGTCTSGTGTLRVVIQCVAVWGDDIVRSGNLVGVGQTSVAHCPSSAWSLQPEPWVATFPS